VEELAMTNFELMVTLGAILVLLALVFADEWFASRERAPPWYPLE
jgi:hypothetical protein